MGTRVAQDDREKPSSHLIALSTIVAFTPTVNGRVVHDDLKTVVICICPVNRNIVHSYIPAHTTVAEITPTSWGQAWLMMTKQPSSHLLAHTLKYSLLLLVRGKDDPLAH